jgi:hypothetical protein
MGEAKELLIKTFQEQLLRAKTMLIMKHFKSS